MAQLGSGNQKVLYILYSNITLYDLTHLKRDFTIEKQLIRGIRIPQLAEIPLLYHNKLRSLNLEKG